MAEQWGGHWVEEGTAAWHHILQEAQNATQTLDSIRRRFRPCETPRNYGCIEYKVMDGLPIVGHTQSQDVIVRICYPRNIDFNPRTIIGAWIRNCLKSATDAATKRFIAVVVLTSWGASVGSIGAATTAAINTFTASLTDCMTTPPQGITIDGQKITSGVYIRDHSMYIPAGNNCEAMYSHWGHSPTRHHPHHDVSHT